tara:strand:- start:266 stop:571 length:306 start_codon:yes stop_codon:yes gene_type:complete
VAELSAALLLCTCTCVPTHRWGQSPPYNNSADQQRFESWLADVTSNRDSHRGYYDVNGVKFMSAAIAERYVNPNLVRLPGCKTRPPALPLTPLWPSGLTRG